jgi:DNA-binding Xre family transcriptional regulator
VHDIDFRDLGWQLAWHRQQRRITQYALAREVGIHPVTLSRLEHGKLPGVTLTVVLRVAMALDMSLNALVRWKPQQWLGDAIAGTEARARGDHGTSAYSMGSNTH